MEYKTDKRTKNLALRDIHVGDWVQAWRPLPKEYTPPMKVSSIHYDGTVYLVSDDEGHCNPFEANIKDVDALQIDADLLKGFGQKRIGLSNSYFLGNSDFFYNIVDKELHGPGCPDCGFKAEYFHKLQDWLEYIGCDINFKWKGIKK